MSCDERFGQLGQLACELSRGFSTTQLESELHSLSKKWNVVVGTLAPVYGMFDVVVKEVLNVGMRIGTLIREKRLGWSRRPTRRSRAVGELEPNAGCRQAREQPEGGWGRKWGSQ